MRNRSMPSALLRPGEVVAAFLLAGGNPGLSLPLLLAVAAFFLTEISANTGYNLLHGKTETATPLSVKIDLGICGMTGLAGLVLSVFSSVWAFLAVCLILFIRIYGIHYRAECSTVLRVALGCLLVPSFSVPSILCTATWTAGLLLYLTGQKMAMTDPAPVAKRPGRRLFLAGAVVSYGTLFGIVIRKPTQDWFALTCGGVSALSSGVFLVLAYWAFRLFQYPVTLGQVAGTGALMSLGLLFLQAGAAAAMDSLPAAFVLLAAAVYIMILWRRKGAVKHG